MITCTFRDKDGKIVNANTDIIQRQTFLAAREAMGFTLVSEEAEGGEFIKGEQLLDAVRGKPVIKAEVKDGSH